MYHALPAKTMAPSKTSSDQTSANTANWKTYTDTDSKISFEYPVEDWGSAKTEHISANEGPVGINQTIVSFSNNDPDVRNWHLVEFTKYSDYSTKNDVTRI